jgi:hypothetical protein
MLLQPRSRREEENRNRIDFEKLLFGMLAVRIPVANHIDHE